MDGNQELRCSRCGCGCRQTAPAARPPQASPAESCLFTPCGRGSRKSRATEALRCPECGAILPAKI